MDPILTKYYPLFIILLKRKYYINSILKEIPCMGWSAVSGLDATMIWLPVGTLPEG